MLLTVTKNSRINIYISQFPGFLLVPSGNVSTVLLLWTSCLALVLRSRQVLDRVLSWIGILHSLPLSVAFHVSDIPTIINVVDFHLLKILMVSALHEHADRQTNPTSLAFVQILH